MGFEEKNWKVFELFSRQWALATAGTPEKFNTCTIGWGSLGSIWGRPGGARPIVTVYIHPSRYTWEFMKDSERFTVCFFPEEYRKALGYLGSHSGRDEDKLAASGLTPKSVGGGVGYEEAELTFVCRKLYQGPFDPGGLSEEIRGGFYKSWEPHWMFVGEILETDDRRGE